MNNIKNLIISHPINKMETNSEIVKSVLRFVTGESEDICRLCLASTQHFNAISLSDAVTFDMPYYKGCDTYEYMLAEVGGPEDDTMPLQLCRNCAESITKSYLFKKIFQYSSELWKEVLLKINTALDCLNDPRKDVATQMVCLLMGDRENNYFTSRTSPNNKHDMVTKLKTYIRQRKFKKKAKKAAILSAKSLSSQLLRNENMKPPYENQYACSKCPKTFKSDWSLKDHTERHHMPKDIQCPKCSKMMSTERLLKIHDDQEHTMLSCKQCFAEFPTRNKLIAHMNNHGVYKCKVCEKVFRNKLTYRTHEKRCGQLTPRSVCDICNASYKYKTALRSHMRVIHGFGASPVACPWCDKKFDVHSRLKVHIIKHTRERNFHCEICGGMFVSQPALINHMRLHTGERPFKCDLCPERFLSASRRMEHKRRKHYGPQKECPYCDSKFVTKFCVEKHVQRHLNPESKLYIGNVEKIKPKNNRKVLIDV